MVLFVIFVKIFEFFWFFTLINTIRRESLHESWSGIIEGTIFTCTTAYSYVVRYFPCFYSTPDDYGEVEMLEWKVFRNDFPSDQKFLSKNLERGKVKKTERMKFILFLARLSMVKWSIPIINYWPENGSSDNTLVLAFFWIT